MGTDDPATGGSGSSPPPADVRDGRRRLTSFPGGFVVGVVVAVAVTLLIVQNGESTQLDWLAFQFEAPLWIMLLLTLCAGVLLTLLGRVVVGRRLTGAKDRRRGVSSESGDKPRAAAKGRKA